MPTYHPGELQLQELTGESETARRNGKMVSDSIPPGARSFLARQRMLAVGHSDADGRMWASLWFGEPGFARAESERALRIQHDEPSLRPGDALGLLAIELGSRRRFRINGSVSEVEAGSIRVEVREAYVNCPQYIQRRQLVEGEPRAPLPDQSGERLDAEQQATIARADTLFVASRHPTSGADVSHRGGNPGFVHVLDPTTLRVPDYPGNGMFNTLGNLHIEPRAGLVIPDFERGRMLLLTGTTRLSVEAPMRFWDFHIQRFVETSMPATHRWEFLDASPHNP